MTGRDVVQYSETLHAQTARETTMDKATDKPSHLRLVAPLDFGGEAPSLTLAPSTDLALLLAEPNIRKKYKEGRYKPGQNVSIKLGSWPSALSVTSSLIAHHCEPRTSMAVVSALALHIGAIDMLDWPAVERLKEIHEQFVMRSTKLKAATFFVVDDLFKGLKPRALEWSPRSIVVSEQVDDDLRKLSGMVGVHVGTLGSICMMITLGAQCGAYVNEEALAGVKERVREFKLWVEWKADTIESALRTFEG